MADHPFHRDLVTAVADEHGIAPETLSERLVAIQRALERGNGKYEYSSQHTFGWQDDEAFYLYGDGIWDTLGDELSLTRDEVAAARAVHSRRMRDSATARGQEETVAGQLEETEALVVGNTSDGDPLFGQDV